MFGRSFAKGAAPGSGRIYHHRIVCWVEKPNVSNASLYQSLAEIRIGSNSDCNGWGLGRISKEAYGRVRRLFSTSNVCNLRIF